LSHITHFIFVGDWRIIIQSKDAGFDQRVIVANTELGDQLLQGNVGGTLDVYGRDKQVGDLRIQHNDGVHGWQDNWLTPYVKHIAGSTIIQVIGSEDATTQIAILILTIYY
jgi:hypothetical protein